VRRGTAGATASALAFILPPFIIVTVVAAIYVSLAGTTMIQALFYGIGPTVIVLILRGAWKLLRVTVKSDRRLWAIFAVVVVATFVARSEVAILFVASGLVGVLLYAPRYRPWPRSVPLLVPPSIAPVIAAAGSADPATLVALGIFFFKAGAFTFGSGLAIVPFLQQGVVHDFGWLSEREFLDAVAMGMITPGPVVITAVFVGYLVAGFAGEQFALPEAIGLLREVRRGPLTGEAVSLSGADPLNLAGILIPGAKLPALTGSRLLYRDGLPVALLVSGEVQFLETLDADRAWALRKALLRSPSPRPGGNPGREHVAVGAA
jgi:chromate transport protein ChrA